MAIEQKGPGGVGNSYGQRTTTSPVKLGESGKKHQVYDKFNIELNPSEDVKRQRPRIGLCGTSITHTIPYRVANSAIDNKDGTWTINFSSSTRQEFGIGESVIVSQGPSGLNTRSATVLSNTGNGGLDLIVLPDLTFTLPLIGTVPLVYYNFARNFGAYPTYVEYMAKCAPIVTVDASLGGADTAQLLTIIDRDLIAYSTQYDVVIAEIGTMNGIYARNNDFDTEWNLVLQYIKKIAAIGKPWLIVGCCPRSSGSGGWSLSKAKIVNRINSQLAVLVPKMGGSFIDPAKASYKGKTYIDPTDVNGGPRITDVSTDGVHPNSGGGIILANPISKWIDNLFPPADPLPVSLIDTDSGMLTTNPLMQGTSGSKTGGFGATVTGNVATGFDVVVEAGGADCSVTCSVIQRTEDLHGDALGNSQRLVITTGATASTLVRFDMNTSVHSSVTNGDLLEALASVVTTNGSTPGTGTPVGLASTNLSILAQTATTINKFIGGNGAGTAAINQEPYSLRLDTPVSNIRNPASIHGAPTNVRARVHIYLRANSSVCIDIGRFGLFKRTADTIAV